METGECLICNKHRGLQAQPPGGYVYEDPLWMVCHAPVRKGPLGTLFIESRRHILDFSEFSDEEAHTFGPLARRVYAALRSLLGASRLYQVSLMEGVPHFHAWIVPRGPGVIERGVEFLAKDLTCTEPAAQDLAARLRQALLQS